MANATEVVLRYCLVPREGDLNIRPAAGIVADDRRRAWRGTVMDRRRANRLLTPFLRDDGEAYVKGPAGI